MADYVGGFDKLLLGLAQNNEQNRNARAKMRLDRENNRRNNTTSLEITDRNNKTSRANTKSNNATSIKTTGMNNATSRANTKANNATSIKTTGMNNATSRANTKANNATSIKTTGMNNATSRANTKANNATSIKTTGMNNATSRANAKTSLDATKYSADRSVDSTFIRSEDARKDRIQKQSLTDAQVAYYKAKADEKSVEGSSYGYGGDGVIYNKKTGEFIYAKKGDNEDMTDSEYANYRLNQTRERLDLKKRKNKDGTYKTGIDMSKGIKARFKIPNDSDL